MEKDYTICIGTVGEGIWQSPDGGETWNRIMSPFPAPFETSIRNMGVDPTNPHRILAGSDVGIYLSDDNGATWEKLESPMDGMQIWSVAAHPTNPDIIFAGTKPPGVFRSRDGGAHWEKLSIDIAEECVAGEPKVTQILFDPHDHNTVLIGVEIDGVFRSLDGGDTWTHLPPLGEATFDQDIHDMALSPGPSGEIHATTPRGIYTSTDAGESWQIHEFPAFYEEQSTPQGGITYTFSYCRGMVLKADDPSTIFVGSGDTIPGETGAVQRTKNGGKTWEECPLPQEPNSNIYWVATHPAEPNRIVANSLNGQVYTSEDAGDSWTKLKREFGEIRALAWMPNQ